MADYSIFRSPVSILLAVSFALVVYMVHQYAGRSRVVRFLAGRTAGAIVMSVVALLMAIEGTWNVQLHTTIPFIAAVILLQICLEFAVLHKLKHKSSWTKRKFTFTASHLGMFLIAWAAFWGAPDVTQATITVDKAQPTNLAYDKQGHSVPLPFFIKLDEFVQTNYEGTQMPKQFTSNLELIDITSAEKTPLLKSTSVNHPCHYMGYTIYQQSFDADANAYSVLRIVRDPWRSVVFLGMLLLAVGSALSLVGRWRRKLLVPVVAVLAVVFAAASIAKINFGTLPPALRSLWFVPHLIIYMVAYSAMAIAVVLALVAFFKKPAQAAQPCPDGPASPTQSLAELSDKLMRTSSVLLLLGMLCGAVWAQQAWGDYWAWDPKENWAAVTWLLTLTYTHSSKRRGLSLALLLASFLALQITWYGVNYLPSSNHSMHTYNTE